MKLEGGARKPRSHLDVLAFMTGLASVEGVSADAASRGIEEMTKLLTNLEIYKLNQKGRREDEES